MKGTKELNKRHYTDVYNTSMPILYLLRGFISFDQKSKMRLNVEYIKSCIEELSPANKNIKLLDYGCGWGSLLLVLSKYKNLKLFCFDIVDEAIMNLKAVMSYRHKVVHPVSIDAELNISINNLNIIVCSHVLEHVDDDYKLLLKFNDALSSGGYLFVNVPINEVWDDPKHIRKYDQDTLLLLLESAGFKVLTYSEQDRWTAFILSQESKLKKKYILMLFRILRLFLALMPLKVLRWSEMIMLKQYDCQQLLVLSTKPIKN